MGARLGVHLFSQKSKRTTASSHCAWVSRCKTACRILDAKCGTPLSIFDFSSVVICCSLPSLSSSHRKVKHWWRLMSTFGNVAKCRWRQTALLIQFILNLPHSFPVSLSLSLNSLMPDKLLLDFMPWIPQITHIFSLWCAHNSSSMCL